MIPKILIAVRRDMADRFELVRRSKLDRRHSSIDLETSDKVSDMLRLWKTLNTVAAGEASMGETGISHCRRLVADCSMLLKEEDVSSESPIAGNMVFATPWKLVELSARKTPYLLVFSAIWISLSYWALWNRRFLNPELSCSRVSITESKEAVFWIP